jgi:hypothetical protein
LQFNISTMTFCCSPPSSCYDPACHPSVLGFSGSIYHIQSAIWHDNLKRLVWSTKEKLRQSSLQGSSRLAPTTTTTGCTLYSSNWCFPFVCIHSNWHLQQRGEPRIFLSLDYKICRKVGWICKHSEKIRGREWPPEATNS